MDVEEKTLLGVIYLATPAVSTRNFPPHVVGVFQKERPWRRGKAVFLPWWAARWWDPRGLMIGLWVPRLRTLFRRSLDEDDDDALWCVGKSPANYSVIDFTTWSNLDEVEENPQEVHTTDTPQAQRSAYRLVRAADRHNESAGAAGHDGGPGSEPGSADGRISSESGSRSLVGDQDDLGGDLPSG